MDILDEKILKLLSENARITVKEIATRIALTSPAVSERIKRMEKSGIIDGYTVILGSDVGQKPIDALVSVGVSHTDNDAFLQLIDTLPAVRQCFRVTGSYSCILKVSCANIQDLESTIDRIQSMGQTSTQIILSTPINRPSPILF